MNPQSAIQESPPFVGPWAAPADPPEPIPPDAEPTPVPELEPEPAPKPLRPPGPGLRSFITLAGAEVFEGSWDGWTYNVETQGHHGVIEVSDGTLDTNLVEVSSEVRLLIELDPTQAVEHVRKMAGVRA